MRVSRSAEKPAFSGLLSFVTSCAIAHTHKSNGETAMRCLRCIEPPLLWRQHCSARYESRAVIVSRTSIDSFACGDSGVFTTIAPGCADSHSGQFACSELNNFHPLGLVKNIEVLVSKSNSTTCPPPNSGKPVLSVGRFFRRVRQNRSTLLRKEAPACPNSARIS